MITRILPLQFLKKSPFHGSFQSMRYRLIRQEDTLNLCIYPGPFGFDATPENKKQYYDFEFSEEGYDKAIELLNQKYEETDWSKEELPFATAPLANIK